MGRELQVACSSPFPLERFDDTAVRDLLALGLRIESIHTEEATLEQVFLAVTGTSLQ